MKILMRLAAGFAVLLGVVLIGAAIALPRLVQRDEVREQVEQVAESALAREFTLGALDAGLLPPSLLIASPRLAGATPDAPPLLEAREIALRLALLPLFTGTVLVDSLVIDGARIHLVRTPEGIELPGAPGAAEAEGAPEPAAPTEPAPPAEAPESGGAPMTIALRQLVLSDATIVFEDRAVTPSVRWELSARASIQGSSLTGPMNVSATLGLASGGELDISGTATLAGELDLDVDLDALALAPAAPYLPEGSLLSGQLAGNLEVAGPAANPSRLAFEVALSDAAIALADTKVEGDIRLEAALADLLAGPTGSFSLDASDARLRFEDVLDKAAGVPMRVSGRLVPGEGAPAIEDLSLVLRNLEANANVRLTPTLMIQASTNALDLSGWEETLLPLAATPLSGAVKIEALTVTTEPMGLRGSVELRDLTAHLPDLAPVVLAGALLLEGDVIRTRELVLRAAEQPFALDARLGDIFGVLTYRASIVTEGADVNALATAYANKPDTLLGPLNLRGDVKGRLGGGKSPLDTMVASLDFDIRDGKLVGNSLLEAALGDLGAVAKSAGRLFVGPEFERFYGEEFDLMKGVLRVENGVANAKPLSIVYRDYGVELKGDMVLDGLALDMKGQLTLHEALDAELADKAGARESYVARKREIPLAGVTGTLDDPKVKVEAGAAARIATAYAGDVYAEKARKKLEKELGPGAAKVVDEGLRALQGLFGGRKE